MQSQAVDRRGTGSIKWDDTLRRLGSDDVLPLWVADMDFPAPDIVRDAMQKRLDHPVYGYTFFDAAFYDAIVWWYRERFGWAIEREWIVPDHGVVVSINTAIAALTQPGDGVLIQTPIYPPFMDAVRRNERTMLENRLVLDSDRYRIDWDDFEAKASEASLFILCSPHNPTTRVWSREEIERMATICRRDDVIIVADEIHSDIVYDGTHVPIGSLEEALPITLTLHAPSKTFNVAGLNTSYAIIPDPTLRTAYQNQYARAGLPHGNPFGIEALKAAYTPEGIAWLDALKSVLHANIEWVQTFLAERLPQIRPVHTEGTFVMWLDCRGLGLDDDALNDLFVEQAHVGLNRGVSFGAAGSGFMRLNIGTERTIIREALERIATAVEHL
jgi:cystathionine beta-lyase